MQAGGVRRAGPSATSMRESCYVDEPQARHPADADETRGEAGQTTRPQRDQRVVVENERAESAEDSQRLGRDVAETVSAAKSSRGAFMPDSHRATRLDKTVLSRRRRRCELNRCSERLRNDQFSVEWDVKPYPVSVSWLSVLTDCRRLSPTRHDGRATFVASGRTMWIGGTEGVETSAETRHADRRFGLGTSSRRFPDRSSRSRTLRPAKDRADSRPTRLCDRSSSRSDPRPTSASSGTVVSSLRLRSR